MADVHIADIIFILVVCAVIIGILTLINYSKHKKDNTPSNIQSKKKQSESKN